MSFEINRRGFLAGAVASALVGGAGVGLRHAWVSGPRARFGAWRARAGDELRASLEGEVPEGAALVAVEVAFEGKRRGGQPDAAEGRVVRVLGAARVEGSEAVVVAAAPSGRGVERYQLGLGWLEGEEARVSLRSNTVEVVCAPFHVGM